MNKKDKLFYSGLTNFLDLGFIRIGGPGLANSLIISLRAYIFSIKNNTPLLNPTWGKLSIGPYLRCESDKRHYFNLFNPIGISGFLKIYILFMSFFNKRVLIKINTMDDCFSLIKENYFYSKEFLNKIIKKRDIQKIDVYDFSNVIGVHVRMGDFKFLGINAPLDYYENLIIKIQKMYGNKYIFYIYTDAQNEELENIFKISNVKRVFFGSALLDMLALSKSKLIIGSNSTFSAFAAFLEQKPIIFYNRNFASPLLDEGNEFLFLKNKNDIDFFINKILN